MIKIDGKEIIITHFPNGESHIEDFESVLGSNPSVTLEYKYTGDESLIHLMFIKRRLDDLSKLTRLIISYMPYSRMDRKIEGKLFTLKYIVEFISNLNFDDIIVMEPHSNVTKERFKRQGVCITEVYPTKEWVEELLANIAGPVQVVFPDEGASLRYSSPHQHTFADNALVFMKKRDPRTGQILSIELDEGEVIKDSTCIIVDDLCSKGGTFMGVASILKERGASNIFLVVAHTEDTVFDGELLKPTSPIDKLITSDSILTRTHDKILIKHGGMYD